MAGAGGCPQPGCFLTVDFPTHLWRTPSRDPVEGLHAFTGRRWAEGSLLHIGCELSCVVTSRPPMPTAQGPAPHPVRSPWPLRQGSTPSSSRLPAGPNAACHSWMGQLPSHLHAAGALGLTGSTEPQSITSLVRAWGQPMRVGMHLLLCPTLLLPCRSSLQLLASVVMSLEGQMCWGHRSGQVCIPRSGT